MIVPPNTAKITRDYALNQIAEAVIYGNLGLFIGAGLPMAIFNRSSQSIALSWGDLIKKCFKEFGIPYKKVNKIGSSYPEIATQLCKLIAAKKKISYEVAVIHLKEKIADLTCLYPQIGDRKKYREFMDALDPSWIITTNYDTVIESILTGKCIPLHPEDQLVVPRNHVPVYHLHGIRTNPNSIVITQDDYVSLFRPNQYRLQKLPLTLKESFTLLIGYNLGDFNVLTALDWSKNVFKSQSKLYPNEMVQLLYRGSNFQSDPYYDNGILILEFNKLTSVLREISKVIQEKRENFNLQIKKLKRFDRKYLDPSKEIVEKFVEDARSRKKVLKLLKDNEHFFINGFLELLSKSNELAWSRTREKNAFNAYDENLKLLLDILETLEVKSTPPALIEMLTYNLNRVAPYIGPNLGESHAAFKTWKKRAINLPPDIIKEILNICRSHYYFQLKELINII